MNAESCETKRKWRANNFTYIKIFSFVLLLLSGFVLQICSANSTSILQLENQPEQLMDSSDVETTEEINNQQDDDYTYAVIVDCGSSGSRAHLFRWEKNADNTAYIKIEPVMDSDGKPLSYKQTPGLTEVVNIDDYITDILGFIKKNISENKHSETTVQFLATAGMRLVDPVKQLQTMKYINKISIETGRTFAHSTVRTIPGYEEAQAEWLTIQMLTGDYFKPHFGLYSEEDRPYHIDGILEMGGASLQVAFNVDARFLEMIVEQLGPDYMKYKHLLNKRTIPHRKDTEKVELVAISFLGLGSNSIRALFNEFLIANQVFSYVSKTNKNEMRILRKYLPDVYKTIFKQNIININDPCMPKGTSKQVEVLDEIFGENYFKTYWKTKEIAKEEITEEERKREEEERKKKMIKINISGSSDFLGCTNNMHSLIDKIYEEELNCDLPEEGPTNFQTNCPMRLLKNLFIPFSKQRFYAVGDFYYPMEMEFGKQKNGIPFDYLKSYLRAVEICNKDYATLLQDKTYLKIYNSKDEKFWKTRIENQCFKMTWILTFLEYGLRLSPLEDSNIVFLNQLNGRSIDWTLGSMASVRKFVEEKITKSVNNRPQKELNSESN